MGLDLWWHDAFVGAFEERTDDRWNDRYEDEPDGAEFHVNWAGASYMVQAMVALGMAYESDPDTASDLPDEEYFRLAGVEERPGIPQHKLGSNDPWHTTPLEIRGALLSAGTPADAPPWWSDLLAFMATALEHGGMVSR